MSDTYASIKAAHSSLPSFSPLIPTNLLPYIALLSLLTVFALTFSFATMSKSKNPLPEISTALLASLLAGGGVVALFCTVGVYV